MANAGRIAKPGWLPTTIALILIIGLGMVSTSCSKTPHDIFMSADVATEDDLIELLPEYEAAGIQFERHVRGTFTSYIHERTIDGAKVEKDRIVYLFDGNTKQLVDKMIQWRTDLPKHLPSLNVTKEQAESMVGGKVRSTSTRLKFISTESHVYPIEPAPKNPCWIVKSVIKEHEGWAELEITIIDAVTGELLGYGVPPP